MTFVYPFRMITNQMNSSVLFQTGTNVTRFLSGAENLSAEDAEDAEIVRCSEPEVEKINWGHCMTDQFLQEYSIPRMMGLPWPLYRHKSSCLSVSLFKRSNEEIPASASSASSADKFSTPDVTFVHHAWR